MVLALHDALQAISLFRSGVDEAMARCARLVVLDFADVSLHDLLWDDTESLDSRERRALRAVWANPNVTVTRSENLDAGLAAAVEYSESHEVSLLIVAAEVLAPLAADPDIGQRILGGPFDLLVVTEHREPSEPQLVESPTEDAMRPATNGL